MLPSTKLKPAVWAIFLTALITLNFFTNILKFVDEKKFIRADLLSEAIVLGAVAANRQGVDLQGFHLATVVAHTKDNTIYQLYRGDKKLNVQEVQPYRSHFGLQGLVFTRIARLLKALGLDRVGLLKLGTALAFALILVLLAQRYHKIYDPRFALIFLLSIAGSPQLISFSSNLYWIPALWLLPALIAAQLYLTQKIWLKLVLLLSIAAAVMVKSLCGYEFLTTITLLACAVFLTAPLFRCENAQLRRRDFGWAVLVFLACVLGFILALLLHAPLRGDSLWEGLKAIYQEDVVRSSYGGVPDSSVEHVRKATASSLIGALLQLLFGIRDNTYSLLWLPWGLIPALLLIVPFTLALRLWLRLPGAKRDLMLGGVMLAVSLSWTVLSKVHSYVHYLFVYGLLYLGLVPALLYLGINSLQACWPWLKRNSAKLWRTHF